MIWEHIYSFVYNRVYERWHATHIKALLHYRVTEKTLLRMFKETGCLITYMEHDSMDHDYTKRLK
jgi:hypothetical protein